MDWSNNSSIYPVVVLLLVVRAATALTATAPNGRARDQNILTKSPCISTYVPAAVLRKDVTFQEDARGTSYIYLYTMAVTRSKARRLARLISHLAIHALHVGFPAMPGTRVRYQVIITRTPIALGSFISTSSTRSTCPARRGTLQE